MNDDWRLQIEVTIDFRRWHPLSLEWEPADEPLPDAAAARAAEQKERIAKERRETEEQGYPRYEVQIELPSRGEADEFATPRLPSPSLAG